MLPGVTDRVLTVTGDAANVLRAIANVVAALSEDDTFRTPRGRPRSSASSPGPAPRGARARGRAETGRGVGDGGGAG